MSVILKGSNTLSLESVTRTWTEATGWESTFRYKGPWTEVESNKTNAVYVGDATSIEARQEKGGLGVLEVTKLTSGSAVDLFAEDTDVWTFQPMKVQKNVWEHEYFDDLDEDDKTVAEYTTSPYVGYKYRIRTAVDAYLSKLQANIEGGNPADATVFDLGSYIDEFDNASSTPNPNAMSANQKKLAISLARLLLSGKDTYETSKYVIRNTKIVPATYSLPVAHGNVEKQWTNGELYAHIVDNAEPSVTKYALLGEVYTVFAGTYWLKEAPVINEVRGGRFEIVQEWVNMKRLELDSLLFNYFGRA